MEDVGGVQYVVNELLTFVIHKLQYMPPDSVTQLCVGFYDYQIIERASKLLFELCGSGSREDRYRRRQGEHKKMATMRDIIALVQRRNNELPVTFVAHNLSNLPPVTFDSIDVCVLLSRMEHVRLEMDALKAVVSTQTSVCDDIVQVLKGNSKPSETQSNRAFEHFARTVESPPARIVESSPARSVESSPARTVESSPARTVESSPARSVESSPARTVESSPARSVESSPARTVESSPARTVESPPARIVESPPALTVESSPARTVESSPARTLESSPARTVELPPARTVESPPARTVESPPARTVESPPDRTVESPPDRTVESPLARTVESPQARTVESPPARTVESSPACTAESPPARTVESSPARIVESSPARIVASSPARIVESSPARIVESSSARTVESPSARIVVSSPARIVESWPARTVESPPARTVESPPARTVESSPARTVESSPARIVESSPARTVESPPARVVESPPASAHDQHTLGDWSTVVKRKKVSQPMMSENHPKRGNNHVRRNDRGSTVIGKATGLHIRAANKRLANVFVSRLAPDLSCDDMSRHIEEVLRMKPIVELVKATSSYSSFHLTCECQDPKAFLDERIWPEGSLVRWWRADKRNNPISTASNELRSDDEILATTDAAL